MHYNYIIMDNKGLSNVQGVALMLVIVILLAAIFGVAVTQYVGILPEPELPSGPSNGGGGNGGGSGPFVTGGGSGGGSGGSGGGSATYEVTNVSAPSSAYQGETVSIDYTIENTGSASGTQDVTVDINNSVGTVTTDSISLSSGGTTTNTASWNTAESQTPQSYTVSVSSKNNSIDALTTIQRPTYTVNIDNVNGPVSQGDTVQVDYTIENTSPVEDQQDITFEANSSVQDSITDLELTSGETSSDTFEWTTNSSLSPGDYDVTVSSETGSQTQSVTVNSSVPVIDPTTESPDKTVSDSGPTSGCSTTVNTSDYNSAVVTVSGGSGGDGDGAYSGDGADGGKITVVADISGVDELCYGAGEQGDDGGEFNVDGGNGYNTGGSPTFVAGQINAGAGGGSSVVADNSNQSNYIAEAGGGGAGGAQIAVFFRTTYQSGGNGANGVTGVGGAGGDAQYNADGSNGGQSAGPLAESVESTGSNSGNGGVVIELYKGKLP